MIGLTTIILSFGCASAPKESTKEILAFKIERPIWALGDTWTYIRGKNTYTQSVYEIKENYVLKEEGPNFIYFLFFTTDLNHSYTTDEKGNITYKNDPPMPDYSWPLTPGKKWSGLIYWKDFKTNTSNTIYHYARAVKVETVKVPAGEFEAVKIVRTAGAWTYTYWYSPKVKKHVKWITENPHGTFIHELVSFHVRQ